MNEKNLDQNTASGEPENNESTILVNDYGETIDSTVVIEEADRTVLLTDTETIIFAKEPRIDIAPKNRPRKVYGGMWGPIEIATAGSAFLAILVVILVYLFLVVPSNRELEKNRAERQRLEIDLTSARDKYGDITSVETHVAKLITSVGDFESNYLPIAATGQTALYQRINGLIARYGLTNTTGPDYAPLEIADQDQNNESDEERGKAKFRSLFPGVYVTTTVEGPYQNLRRFIRDIETANEFVVISAVDLEPSETEQKSGQAGVPVQAVNPIDNFPANPRPGGFPGANTSISVGPSQPLQSAPRGKTHGATVRLRLEMAAYFRRPNVEPVEPEAGTQ